MEAAANAGSTGNEKRRTALAIETANRTSRFGAALFARKASVAFGTDYLRSTRVPNMFVVARFDAVAGRAWRRTLTRSTATRKRWRAPVLPGVGMKIGASPCPGAL